MDDEDEIDEGINDTAVWDEMRIRMSRQLKTEAEGSQQHDTSDPSAPEMLFPPVHLLLNLRKCVEHNKQAVVYSISNQIKSKSDKIDIASSWEDIEKKKRDLQELFVNAEKGIKENQASKARFHEIIKENDRYKVVVEKGIEATQENLKEYRHIEQQFKQYLDKYSIFENFLESVSGNEENWRTVRDVLDRYETLRRTHEECGRILEQELEEAAELRKKMLVVLEDKSSVLKSLNNRLVALEVQRKDARNRRHHWEYTIQRIKNALSVKMDESSALSQGINDLYRCMCRKLKVEPSIPLNNFEGQVDFIHKNIMYYKEVLTIASGLRKTELKTGNKK
ncbi:coiled-coil domain-containing protein 42 homolog [Macrosteles quadrilineatus]|uniref:coiled-coil domain-containing protein 42 homolog n=1 Tax=Macrosteles quadrilineatus TaxID=74068 RepID=UPI0023E2DDD2|nr:coiled-coil domain-containing protein 42 homolog [Macrosteles quadrilineatus]